jgi:hypothetical protein
MRNKFILSVLLVCVTGSAWSQFYANYSETERKTLAEAYYLAGAQYVKVGKAEMGKEYENLAFRIYPQLAPSSIVEPKQPTAEELLAQGMAARIGVPETAAPEIMPRSFFLRYLGAFLEGDPAAVAGFFDGSVHIDSRGMEFDRDEIETEFKRLYSEVSLAGVEPTAVYDLDSIVIIGAPASMQKSWGETAILRVNAKADYSPQLDFWETQQQFFVHKLGSGWHIFAAGQNPPPLDWKPKALPAAAPVAAPAEVVPAPDQQIEEAFKWCVTAFLQKDLEGTLSYITKELRILRMRQTVSGEELATTFQAYFDGSDFQGAGLSDVIDESSMFVEPTNEFAGEIEGPVYTLNVKAKLDMSDKIPFWTTYQRYYFLKEDDSWKVFAVF